MHFCAITRVLLANLALLLYYEPIVASKAETNPFTLQLKKNVFSNQTRLLIVAGLEGTGQHIPPFHSNHPFSHGMYFQDIMPYPP